MISLDPNTNQCVTRGHGAEGPMARRAWVWTQDRVRAVQASVAVLPTVAAIAQAHGLPVKTVSNACDRGIIVRPVYSKRDDAEVTELIPRDCLCCGKRFNAETRFIRSCDDCRTKGSPLGDWGMGIG